MNIALQSPKSTSHLQRRTIFRTTQSGELFDLSVVDTFRYRSALYGFLDKKPPHSVCDLALFPLSISRLKRGTTGPTTDDISLFCRLTNELVRYLDEEEHMFEGDLLRCVFNQPVGAQSPILWYPLWHPHFNIYNLAGGVRETSGTVSLPEVEFKFEGASLELMESQDLSFLSCPFRWGLSQTRIFNDSTTGCAISPKEIVGLMTIIRSVVCEAEKKTRGLTKHEASAFYLSLELQKGLPGLQISGAPKLDDKVGGASLFSTPNGDLATVHRAAYFCEEEMKIRNEWQDSVVKALLRRIDARTG